MLHNTYEEINPAHGKLPNGALVSIKKKFHLFSHLLFISIHDLLWIHR